MRALRVKGKINQGLAEWSAMIQGSPKPCDTVADEGKRDLVSV